MKKILNSKYFIAIMVVVMALYNALLFLLTKKDDYTTNFFTVYGFIMFAFLLTIVVAIVLRDKTSEGSIYATTFFAGCYLQVIVVVGTIFFFFVNKVNFLVIFIPLLIITAFFIIFFIFGLMQEEWIKKNPQKLPELFSMHEIVPYLEGLKLTTNNKQVFNQLQVLIDKVNLSKNLDSDTDELKSIDKKIFELVQFIGKNIHRGENQNVFNNISSLDTMLLKREELIKK